MSRLFNSMITARFLLNDGLVIDQAFVLTSHHNLNELVLDGNEPEHVDTALHAIALHHVAEHYFRAAILINDEEMDSSMIKLLEQEDGLEDAYIKSPSRHLQGIIKIRHVRTEEIDHNVDLDTITDYLEPIELHPSKELDAFIEKAQKRKEMRLRARELVNNA